MFTQLLTELNQVLAETRDKARWKSSVGEAVRHNVSYLKQAAGSPMYQALKGLQGF